MIILRVIISYENKTNFFLRSIIKMKKTSNCKSLWIFPLRVDEFISDENNTGQIESINGNKAGIASKIKKYCYYRSK